MPSRASGHCSLRGVTEASLVGGIADWFAIVALFERPLGLPIPHTGVIPRNKDRDRDRDSAALSRRTFLIHPYRGPASRRRSFHGDGAAGSPTPRTRPSSPIAPPRRVRSPGRQYTRGGAAPIRSSRRIARHLKVGSRHSALAHPPGNLRDRAASGALREGRGKSAHLVGRASWPHPSSRPGTDRVVGAEVDRPWPFKPGAWPTMPFSFSMSWQIRTARPATTLMHSSPGSSTRSVSRRDTASASSR